MHTNLKRLLLDAITSESIGSQAGLAKRIGLDQATVSRWLSGRQGVDVGSCLRLARLTGEDPAKILRWAGHDPGEFLPPGGLPESSEAIDLAERARLLDWMARRKRVAPHLRAAADRTVDSVLDNFATAVAGAR